MKRFLASFIKSMVIVLVFFGPLAANLQAQSDAITVRVPFPFTVGAQTIAAGAYQFSLVSSGLGSDEFLLSMLNIKTGDAEMFAVHPEQQPAFEQQGHLNFRNSANGKVLTEVHFPGTDTFSELIHTVAPEESKQCSPRQAN
jgi:hypothetical protein